jgi:hypothetical protein
LQQDTNFNVMANIPVGRLLGALVGNEGQPAPGASELPVVGS